MMKSNKILYILMELIVNNPYFYLVKKTFLEKGIFIKNRCYVIFKNKKFENFILFVIILSSLNLVIDTYGSI